MSQTICPLPFTHQQIQPDGEIRFCCAARPNSNKNHDGTVNNVTTNKMIEAWNSDSLKKLRLSLINNQTPDECGYCWVRENAEHTSGSSMRLDSLQKIPLAKFQDRVKEAKENSGQLKSLPYDFQVMSGNLCNLSCKMCTPQYSTTFSKYFNVRGYESIKEIKFNPKSTRFEEYEQHYNKTYDWPVTHPLKEVFVDYYDSIATIFFLGGEPTILDGTHDFLNHLNQEGFSNQIDVWFSTNGTNINKNFLSTLNKFSSVSFNISLDGKDEIAYIQRTPSNWNQIKSNLDKLFLWAKNKQGATQVNIHSVVTSLNLHHILDFWLYLINEYQDDSFGISFMPIVEDDDNFSILLVPEDIVKQIKQRVQKARAGIPEQFLYLIDKFEHLLETTSFDKTFNNIHFQLDQIQKFHPDMDIKQIYSIYY